MHDEIRQLIIRVFGEDLEQWSSLQQIELMLALEERYGVTLTTEEMTRLTSPDAIEDYLNSVASG